MGDLVKRPDRHGTYILKGKMPVKDCQGIEQTWAVIEDERTGKRNTVNINYLEAIA